MVKMDMFNVQWAITPNVGRPELLSMCFARCLMVLYIYVKFRENITNDFRVMERTRVHGKNGYVQCSKGSNSKSRQTQFVCSAHYPMVLYIYMKFRENISKGTRVLERTQSHEALTDGHSKFGRYNIISRHFLWRGIKSGTKRNCSDTMLQVRC